MKKITLITIMIGLLLSMLLMGCATDADVASQRLSKSADMFEVTRRIVFYNGISGEYILVLEGLCSLGNFDDTGELTVTCKVGPTEYKKHFLGLSDNVTYFAEQIDSVSTDVYHYKVIFKPSVILPDIDIK